MWFSAVFNSRFKSTLFYRLLYFFLFPVPFNFILYDICKSKYRKGAVHLSILYLCNIAAAVLLQCAGIIDIFRILPITHLIMLVNVIYTVTLIRYESIKLQNEAARHFKYPMYLVLQNLLLTISGIFNKPPSSFHWERCYSSFCWSGSRYHVFMINISRNKSLFTYRNLRTRICLQIL